MSKIVVCALHRLGKDGDSFSKKLVAKVERTNVKIGNDYVKEFNANWRTSGRVYVIDEKLTAERDKLLSEKSKDKGAKSRAELKKEADELGLVYSSNIPTKKLIELIKEG